MIGRHPARLLAAVLVLAAVTGAALRWHYGPIYHRRQRLAEAEKLAEGNDVARILETLEGILKEEPAQVRAWLLYAQVLRRLGRGEEARGALLKAKELGLPEAEAGREYALLLAAAGLDLRRAERLLQEQPDDPEVHQALAEGYANSRRWLDAERAYTRCLELRPDRGDYWFGRGRVRQEAEHFGDAAADSREAVRRSPEDFQTRWLLIVCLLADARIAEAEQELLLCRQLHPARAEPLIGLATCALERGNPDQAQALLTEALDRDPSSILALIRLGNLYLSGQHDDLAIPVFEKVVRLNPRDKQGHLKLAQALRRTGDPERATEHLRRYQELLHEEQQRLPGPPGMR
jgi:cytochrome c-type biogenesis protein CcmH/NrfG